MSKRLTKSDEVYIVNAYVTDLVPMIDLAKKFGITRQGVCKALKRCGVDTSTKGTMKVSCASCGAELLRQRCRIRKQKNHFCDTECYYAYLDASQQGVYKQSRTGQRIARRVVSEYFDLKDGHIVHHEDRNNLNNWPNNLKVFANQGDHIRWHRLGPDYVTPVWDGSKVSQFK